MDVKLLLLALWIPFFLFRLLILHRNIPKSLEEIPFGIRVLSKLSGFLQDFIIVLQLYLIFHIVKVFCCSANFLIGMTAAIYSLAILECLVDAFLYKSTHLRLEAPFFAFLNDLKCFWDSAKEKKVAWFYPIGALWFVLSTTFFYCIMQGASILPLAGVLKVICSFIVVSIVGLIALPKKLTYGMENIMFSQQVWLVKKFYSLVLGNYFFAKSKHHLRKEIFTPQSEKYSTISTRFPLLKHTHGFFGDKQCEIKKEENEKINIVFLFLESFRAKDVGCLGGQYDVSPNFDRLSKEGYLFKNFYANSVKTSRAAATSLFGIPSDVNSSEISSKKDMPFISLAHQLSKNKYHNAYLHNGVLEFENQNDFFSNHGYETMVGRNDILKDYPEAPLTSWGVHDEYLMRYTADWFEKKSQCENPIFLTMFTISNHHPWTLPHHFQKIDYAGVKDSRYNRFLNTFRYSDESLGLLIQLFREKNLSKNTVFFIMGDHGHPMGERQGNFVEQRNLYDENLKVPLLILADGRIENPQSINEVASQVDLVPTVMDLLSINGLNHSRGSSLLRKCKRQVFFHNPYAFRFYGTRKDTYKLIYTHASKEVELFDLALDPNEQNNIVTKFPQLAANLLSDVKSYREYYKSLYDTKRFSPFEMKKSLPIVEFSEKTSASPSKLLAEIKKYPFIFHLDLSHCDLISDETLHEMVKIHTEIKSLNLANCKKLTSKSLESIVEHCQNLQFLDISGCQFSYDDIEGFVKLSHVLEKIIKKDDKNFKALF